MKLRLLVCLLAALGLPVDSAWAQAGAASAAAEDTKLKQARELFIQGNTLLEAKDYERALVYFRKSRALVPSISNTSNAAFCLMELKRSAEALELFEELLTKFGEELTAEEKRSIGQTARDLRKQVGSLDVSANVEGKLIVNGRQRGTLPLSAPLRLLPGRHVVRVLRDGYEPAEQTVDIEAGRLSSVDLKLEALTAFGRVKVVEASGKEGLEVVIDGAPVGLTPWEGNLGKGAHLVSLRSPELGTAPKGVTVSVGQTLTVKLRAEAVGPPIRLQPIPETAVLTLGETRLGPGVWNGRLPRRAHQVTAREEGYFPRTVELPPGKTGSVSIELKVNPDHPRWPKTSTGAIRLHLFGGLGFSPSLRSDAERSCPGRCDESSLPTAWLVGLGLSYELKNHLRLGLVGGALRLGTRVERRVDADFGIEHQIRDDIEVAGGFGGLSVAYNAQFGDALSVVPRLSFGSAFLATRDDIRITAQRDDDSAELVVNEGGVLEGVVSPMLLPEISVEYGSDHWFASASVAQLMLLRNGLQLQHGEARVLPAPDCDPNERSVACDQIGTRRYAGERAYRRTYAVLVNLGVGYKF